MSATAPLRFLRTCVITAAVLGLAAGAHAAAGGHLPPAAVMTLLTVLVMAPVMALSRYRLSLPAIGGILAAGQGLLHLAFTGLSSLDGHCAPAGVAAHTHHQTFAIPDCALAASTAAAAAGDDMAAGAGAAMTAAHVLATAVTALILARGEAALWQLRAWLRPLAGILHPVSMPPTPRIPALRSATAPIPAASTSPAQPRGPPFRTARPLQTF
ncbi:hypothetical protein ACQR35_14180 [Pseudarthrobacter sp. J1738]|uniref:hypothetical protein n=1 Tax=Pseudarthrobacter sp. J1738 TaxID=3420446 RepID=UPI003D28F96C